MKNYLKFLLPFSLCLLLGCNSIDRQRTFLDFEYGMTYDEFQKHAEALERSGVIRSRSGRDFEYILNLNGKYLFFACRANVFRNSRLRSIVCDTKYGITKEERDLVIQTVTSKYGQPSYPFQVNPYSPDVSNVKWDLKNSYVNMTIGNDFPTWYFRIDYSATGKLYDNLVKKDKKENGEVEVQNKY